MSGTGPAGPGGERRRVDPLTGLPLDPPEADNRPTTALPRPGTEPTSWIPRPPENARPQPPADPRRPERAGREAEPYERAPRPYPPADRQGPPPADRYGRQWPDQYPPQPPRRAPNQDERDPRGPGQYRDEGYRDQDYRREEYRHEDYRHDAYEDEDRRAREHRSRDYGERDYRDDRDYRDRPRYEPRGEDRPGHRGYEYDQGHERYPGDPYDYPADPYDSRPRRRPDRDGDRRPYERRPYEDPGPDYGYPEQYAEPPRIRPPDAPLTPRRSYPSPEYPDLTKRPIESRGSHLPPYHEPLTEPETPDGPPATKPSREVDPTAAVGGRSPRKLTVTRVAALRSRELTSRGVQLFYRATTADGADVSGLAHLTYAVMGNYAVDAALMVALANTIFFADTGSTGKVLLYLLITVAPFAVVAPLIGPMLDKMQRGRRLALALSSFGRALLTLVMVFNMIPFNGWVIYPCALGNLVLSKAFSVLKAALTPRVLPDQITLVKTNSRLTVFGLLAGGVAGAIAAGLLKLFDAPGALIFTAVCGVIGGVLCLRIPSWVESTEGEVPVRHVTGQYGRRGFPTPVRITLWTNSVIRVETGFLALFMAFVVKNQFPNPPHSAFTQLLLLGIIGGAAGVGGFVGNALGARLNLANPELIALITLSCTLVACLVAVMLPGMATSALVGLVGSTSSSLAKVCLDSTIQHGLPEVSRASAFGKTESVLQLAGVSGGVVGLLIGGVWFGHKSAVYTIGFGVIGVLLALGLTQVLMLRAGRTLLPQLNLPGRKAPAAPPPPIAAAPQRAGVNPDPSAAHALPPTRRAPIRADGKTRKRPRKAGTDR